MQKLKTLRFNNKSLLIIGSIAILLIIVLWGVLDNVYERYLHGSPTTPLTPLSGIHKIDVPRKGPRFVMPNEPIEIRIEEEIYKPVENIKLIEPIKLVEPIKLAPSPKFR